MSNELVYIVCGPPKSKKLHASTQLLLM